MEEEVSVVDEYEVGGSGVGRILVDGLYLQDVPRGESGMRARGPVFFNGEDRLFRCVEALEHCQALSTGRASLVVRRRSKRPSDQERAVHHDSEIAISPLGDS